MSFDGDNVTRDFLSTNSHLLPSLAQEDGVDDFLEQLNLAEAWELIPTIAYICVLMVVGVVGNVVVMLVYGKRFKPSATRCYVLAMSAFDLVANVLVLPMEIVDIRFAFTFHLPLLCKVMRSANSLVTLASAFLLVAVARDRRNKICRPLERHGSLRRVQVNIFFCILASVVLTIPFGMLNGSKTKKISTSSTVATFNSELVNEITETVNNSSLARIRDDDTAVVKTTGDSGPVSDSHPTPSPSADFLNITGVTCSVDDAYADTLFPVVYSGCMFLSFLACVTILITSYVSIGKVLWRHKRAVDAHRLHGFPTALSGTEPGADQGKTAKDGFEESCAGRKLKNTSESIVEDTISSGPGDAGSTVSTSAVDSSAERAAKSTPRDSVLEESSGPTKVSSSSPDGGKRSLLTSLQAWGGSATAEPILLSRKQLNGCSCAPLLCGDHQNDALLGGDARGTNGDHQKGSPPALPEPVSDPSAIRTSVAGGDGGTVGEDLQRRHQQNLATLPSSTSGTENRRKSATVAVSLRHTLMSSTAGSYTVNPGPAKREQGLNAPSATKPKPRRQKREAMTVRKIPSSTTFMMFVLSATFIINYLPHLIIITARAISGDLDRGLTGWLRNAHDIALRSYLANCAVNSIVYGFCNARFRQECWKLICGRR